MRSGGAPVIVAALPGDAAARRRARSPAAVRISVVLPMPLRPSRPSERPAGISSADAAQHVAVAVARVQVGRWRAAARHRRLSARRRGRRCCTARSLRIASGTSLAMTWPLTITVIRSATRNTASMSCSTSRIACVALQRGEQREHAVGLLGAHAGERLVEQQHARRGRQAHRDLELALGAVAERRRRVRAGVAGEAGGASARARDGEAVAHRWRRAPRPPTAAARSPARARRQFSSTLNSAKIVVRW